MNGSSAVRSDEDARERPPELFGGPLAQLIHVLTAAARQVDAGTWCQRRLAKGAVVSLKYTQEGTRMLQLWRPLGPMADEARRAAAWQNECNIFLRFFRTEHWEPVPPAPLTETPGMVAAFREPADPR